MGDKACGNTESPLPEILVTHENARRVLIRARREMALMNREYSGCDWCCGGGDEAMAAEALKVLEGEYIPTLCEYCFYYDAREGYTTCELCAAWAAGGLDGEG